MKESDIQNDVLLAISEAGGVAFRYNVGSGWISDKFTKVKIPEHAPKPYKMMKCYNGDVVVRHARWFNAGPPAGHTDLGGVLPVTITPDMVGQTIGVAIYPELKTKTGKAKKHQDVFMTAMRGYGALSGIIRAPEDVEEFLLIKPAESASSESDREGEASES